MTAEETATWKYSERDQRLALTRGCSICGEQNNWPWFLGMSLRIQMSSNPGGAGCTARHIMVWSGFAQHPIPTSQNLGRVAVRKVHLNYTVVKNTEFLVRSVSDQIVKVLFSSSVASFKTSFAARKARLFYFRRWRKYCGLIGKARGILLPPPEGKPDSNLCAEISQFGSASGRLSLGFQMTAY